ncbi:hypothetical protein BHM03_00004892 [Ensete ventricosum]|uniref:Uncharacterized protein n=1 Tax=Ensete ventricosum TaxID=4639 RepID=A0A445MAV3_ENSVE|nr:hypothetical protein BHM03_00004892 [Ensete ventricosum]
MEAQTVPTGQAQRFSTIILALEGGPILQERPFDNSNAEHRTEPNYPPQAEEVTTSGPTPNRFWRMMTDPGFSLPVSNPAPIVITAEAFLDLTNQVQALAGMVQTIVPYLPQLIQSVAPSRPPKRREDRPDMLPSRPPPIPLNSTRTEIFLQIWERGLLKTPNPMKTRSERRDKMRYCRFHKEHGHDTEEYRDLQSQIEELIRQGHLRRYVRDQSSFPDSRPPRDPSPQPKGPVEKQIDVIIGGTTSGSDSSSTRKADA